MLGLKNKLYLKYTELLPPFIDINVIRVHGLKEIKVMLSLKNKLYSKYTELLLLLLM